jgi:aminopeptidase N
VSVRLLLQPEHEHLADRHFAAAFNSLRYFGLWFGPYPYETLTLVDPAHNAGATGGMEYPTLITLGTSVVSPRATQSPEGVLSHEFAHQYWYGLLANDETAEAWLDEGFTSYTETLAREKLDPDLPHPIDSTRFASLPVFATPLFRRSSGPPATRGARATWARSTRTRCGGTRGSTARRPRTA